ncbi:hypothetical protein [Winogradskyella aurantiaca]|uniref:hypothetical protein n=1 Tax=Winogradskyella aurantiaca TaxID=2219558 RepID=UPI0013003E09|nr:hypothetical protein [Winogradskyella aurantiaca]
MKSITHILIIILALSFTNCVQETHLKTVTFKVDMRQVDNPSQVGVRGNFTENSWNDTLLMKDNDADGVNELTIEKKTAINGIEFKFVNAHDQFELKDQNNRSIQFEYKPEMIVYEAVFNKSKGTQTSIK